MSDNINMQHIRFAIEEISSYVDNLLDAKSYEDNICYLLGFLSDVEHILVTIGNMRFDSLLSERQIQLEEDIFDGWMDLYNIAKVIMTRRRYSEEYKKTINELTRSTFTKLKEFEIDIRVQSI